MKRDHSKLVCDISEISCLFKGTERLDTFLQQVVYMIAQHMRSEVCSIYLYDENKDSFVLKATKGLNQEAIGKIQLKHGEGLTGLAIKRLHPVCVKHASRDKNYKYFPGIGEENYESFLAVPILRGRKCIGAVVIQNAKEDYFTNEDINVLRAITAQLANTIEIAHLFIDLKEKEISEFEQPRSFFKNIKFIKGKSGADGFGYGEIIIFQKERYFLRQQIQQSNVTYTLSDLHNAIKKSEEYLENLQEKVATEIDDMTGMIFSAQILMLKDSNFIKSIVELFNNQISLPDAVLMTVDRYSDMFDKLPNEYLREKKKDIEDIGNTLIRHLTGISKDNGDYSGYILIAQELYPSDILKLFIQGIAGIILLSGGITSHCSILSRSLNIPLIICEDYRLLNLPPKTEILMDADHGNIYINPQDDILKTFKDQENQAQIIYKIKDKIKNHTYTKDGTRISLLANINLLKDIKLAKQNKLEGIGLYRTEFPFIIRADFPTEEEQFMVYKKLVTGIPGQEITFRTLDVGGDKVLSYYDYGKENNPFLGMRSIRFSLKHENIFDQQLRAILRAGYLSNIKIVFPMISSIDEFDKAKERVLFNIDKLKKDGVLCNDDPQIGIMIELPAVVEIIDEFVSLVDFFSIGTNDFIQYMLAVDRTNEKVADLYLPYHPAILRALNKIVQKANENNKEVSICGDMAYDTRYTSFLLGIGLRRFSIDPHYCYKIQQRIQDIDLGSAVKNTKLVLEKNTILEIENFFNSNNT